MKKNLLKKGLCCALAVVVSAGMFTGCGKNEEASNGDVPKIKVFIPNFKMANAQNIVEEINKRAGVELEVLEDAGGEGATKSSLMITTGEKVDWINISDSQPFKEWGEQELINDLSSIIEENKEDLPVINMLVNDDTYKALKGPNGEVWVIPAINYITNVGLRINKDWFESTGMPMPETTEDIYQLLKKMKETKCVAPDYTPFISDGLASLEWAFFAYGGRLSKNGKPRFYEENGEFKNYVTSDMNKEALKYLRKLFAEGLINPDFQVIGGTSQRSERFLAGKAGMWFSSNGIDEQLYESIGTTTVWPAAPKGPTGIQSFGGEAPLYRMNVIPTSVSDEKQILNVLKFIEWMHSEEARLLCSYGIEGRHYEINEKGEVDSSKPEYVANKDADFGRVNGGSSPFQWGWVSPFCGTLDTEKYDNVIDALANMELIKAAKKEPVDESYMDFVANINKYLDPYPYVLYTSDELVQAGNTAGEFATKFYVKCMTEENFDIDAEWDNFVNEYNTKNRGQECLEIFKKLIEE